MGWPVSRAGLGGAIGFALRILGQQVQCLGRALKSEENMFLNVFDFNKLSRSIDGIGWNLGCLRKWKAKQKLLRMDISGIFCTNGCAVCNTIVVSEVGNSSCKTQTFLALWTWLNARLWENVLYNYYVSNVRDWSSLCWFSFLWCLFNLFGGNQKTQRA